MQCDVRILFSHDLIIPPPLLLVWVDVSRYQYKLGVGQYLVIGRKVNIGHKDLMPIFCSQDHDRRIREATQQAFEQLVLKVRRNLAPFLRSLMGHWILSQCDTYTPAASAACQAFQAAFSPAKQPEALSFCKDEILNVSRSAEAPQKLCNIIKNISEFFHGCLPFQVLQDILLKETADTLSDTQ